MSIMAFLPPSDADTSCHVANKYADRAIRLQVMSDGSMTNVMSNKCHLVPKQRHKHSRGHLYVNIVAEDNTIHKESKYSTQVDCMPSIEPI